MKKKKKQKHSELVIKELRKTIPLSIIGIIFHTITLYILLYTIKITGGILDMILQEGVTKEQIMQELYKLIFYSVIIIIPHLVKRFFYFIVSKQVETRIRKKVYDKLQYVQEEYYENVEKGKYMAYLTKELQYIKKFFGDFFNSLTDLVMTPILAVIISANSLNIKLTLLLGLILIMALIIIWRLYSKKREKIEDSRKQYIEMSKIIEQNTSNFMLVKLYNNQEEQRETFIKENDKMKEKDYEIGKVDNAIRNVVKISEALSYITVIVYGAYLLSAGQMTVGDLTVFTTFLGKIFGSLNKRIRHITDSLLYFKQSIHRIDSIMGEETYEKEDKQNIDDIKSIKTKNLNYRYPNCEKYVIKNLNFEINKNDKIGIIGMFGSGKTTLMNIISGLYKIEENQVFINDVDITKINKYSLFDKISYILQKTVLINDTIKNNITFENQYESKEIVQASDRACILEDVFKMEHEFEEIIGEKGIRLSGGQKQRITIARNMIVDRDFIILDNVFSALDANTEQQVLDNILNLKDKTIIIIANKVSNVEKLDKIYLMDNGEFLDSGTHEELLSRNSIYREMYEYEMAGEIID